MSASWKQVWRQPQRRRGVWLGSDREVCASDAPGSAASRVVEVLGDSFREPSMLIRDHIRYALESALPEPAEGLVPSGKA